MNDDACLLDRIIRTQTSITAIDTTKHYDSIFSCHITTEYEYTVSVPIIIIRSKSFR